MNELLVSLATDYIDIVDRIRYGIADPDDLSNSEACRGVLHEQLLSLLGEDRLSVDNMYRLAWGIVLEARSCGG